MAFQSEDIENCILGICCEPTRQMKALAKKLHEDTKLADPIAMTVAAWILDHYDLAPKGDLESLFKHVAEMAREYPYQG